MKINLIFYDWINERTGESVYCTEEGIQLSLGDFHSGTVFTAEVQLEDYRDEFEAAAKSGIVPVFYATLAASFQKGGIAEP